MCTCTQIICRTLGVSNVSIRTRNNANSFFATFDLIPLESREFARVHTFARAHMHSLAKDAPEIKFILNGGRQFRATLSRDEINLKLGKFALNLIPYAK